MQNQKIQHFCQNFSENIGNKTIQEVLFFIKHSYFDCNNTSTSSCFNSISQDEMHLKLNHVIKILDLSLALHHVLFEYIDKKELDKLKIIINDIDNCVQNSLMDENNPMFLIHQKLLNIRNKILQLYSYQLLNERNEIAITFDENSNIDDIRKFLFGN